MRRILSGLLIITLVSVGFGGCATKTQTGAGVGAATGAALGAAIGGAVGGRGGVLIGAGIGVVLGAAIGAGLGKYFEDREERKRAESVRVVAYNPQQGNLISVGGSDVSPVPAKPGDQVRVKVSYDLLTPNPEQMVPVTERWLVMYDGKPVGQPIVRPTQHKSQGGHSSTFKFDVNKDFLPGEYLVITTISNGESERSIRSIVLVQNA